jgi:hypothetical protein
VKTREDKQNIQHIPLRVFAKKLGKLHATADAVKRELIEIAQVRALGEEIKFEFRIYSFRNIERRTRRVSVFQRGIAFVLDNCSRERGRDHHGGVANGPISGSAREMCHHHWAIGWRLWMKGWKRRRMGHLPSM